MIDRSSTSSSTVAHDQSPIPAAAARWQFSIRTMMLVVSVCAVVAWLLRTRLGAAMFGLAALTLLPLALLVSVAIASVRLGERLQLSPKTFPAALGLVLVAVGAVLLYIAVTAAVLVIGIWFLALFSGQDVSAR